MQATSSGLRGRDRSGDGNFPRWVRTTFGCGGVGGRDEGRRKEGRKEELRRGCLLGAFMGALMMQINTRDVWEDCLGVFSVAIFLHKESQDFLVVSKRPSAVVTNNRSRVQALSGSG